MFREPSRLDRLRTKADFDARIAEEEFDSVDVDKTNTLTREQMSELLRRITGLAEIREDGLDMVFYWARHDAGGADAIARDTILRAVKKFRYFLTQAPEIDAIYEEFDSSRDGKLSKDELRQFLRQKEFSQSTRMKRKKDGHVVPVAVSLKDTELDYILIGADVDADGSLDKAEILSALARWHELTHHKLDKIEKDLMCGCSLM